MAELAKAGDFRPNPGCQAYEQAQKSCGNIIKFSHIRLGCQHYKCKTPHGAVSGKMRPCKNRNTGHLRWRPGSLIIYGC